MYIVAMQPYLSQFWQFRQLLCAAAMAEVLMKVWSGWY